MRDRPTPEELLQGARAVLDRDIAPSLQGRARFAAILVSRAMSVAARAIANGDAPLRAEAQRLAALLGRPPAAALAPQTLPVAVEDLNRVLTQRIRKGDFDSGNAGQRLFDHLRQVTLDKLSESNPKYLEKDKAE
ncbi:MAG: DUF6285 domain-containing protein [Burkholderiaceae bacterium]|nr:DUF6285 domain-containing protein [Burkholderiaceae bacterium]